MLPLWKKNLIIKQVLGAWWHLLRSTSLPLCLLTDTLPVQSLKRKETLAIFLP